MKFSRSRLKLTPLSLAVLTTMSACTGPAERIEPVHLGNVMYELQRRFSALWFAGVGGNPEMVKYQSIEIGEIVDNIRAANPHEGGVSVVARLELHVLDRLDSLVEASEAGDRKAFEERYHQVMGGCNGCHVETNHAFIDVRLPEYNPYPSLHFGSSE